MAQTVVMDLALAQLILRLLLALVFIGMGVLHFFPGPQKTMAAMIPPRLRWEGILRPRSLVIVTGLFEIAGGIGIVLPATSTVAGILLVALLIALFPANAYAAAHPERFGSVAMPLIPRLIGQLILIALVIAAILPV